METVTNDISQFGFRELDMAADLLKEYATNGAQFLYTGVNVFMNKNSGFVFLTDDDANVGILENGKLVQFFSCPQCGNEGTQADGEAEEWDFEKYNGYCSNKCEKENN